MIEKYKEILQLQLNKLEEKDFDFEAWKTSSIIVLSRIFGPLDMKISQLTAIRVEYGSSWSMRTVTGSFDPVLSAKKQGREILSVAISELELYGDELLNPCGQLVEDSLSEVLSMKNYNALLDILKEGDTIVKRENLNQFLKKLTKDELTMVLSVILEAQ